MLNRLKVRFARYITDRTRIVYSEIWRDVWEHRGWTVIAVYAEHLDDQNDRVVVRWHGHYLFSADWEDV